MRTGRLVAALFAASALGATTSAFAQTNAPAAPTPNANPPAPTTRGMTPADQPLLKKLPQPTSFAVEGGAGIVGFVGGVGGLGPGWNVRVTGALSPSFAIEGNYVGSINQRADTSDTLVMTAVDAGVRYNLTAANVLPVQPFVVGGIGYAGFAGKNGDAATLIIPISAGADRMLTQNIKVGARFSYRPAFFDNLAGPATPKGATTPGADTWSLLAQLGGGF